MNWKKDIFVCLVCISWYNDWKLNLNDLYLRIISPNYSPQKVGVWIRCWGEAFGWSWCFIKSPSLFIPREEKPKDRLLLQKLYAIRIAPDSYPNYAPLYSLPSLSHPVCFGRACRRPLVCIVFKRIVSLVGCGIFGRSL